MCLATEPKCLVSDTLAALAAEVIVRTCLKYKYVHTLDSDNCVGTSSYVVLIKQKSAGFIP